MIEKKSLFARERGEIIVRRWNDDVETLKAEHKIELVKRDVTLEEQKRLVRMSNKKIVDLEIRLKKHGGHTGECSTLEPNQMADPPKQCDCGWTGHHKSCPARLGSTCDCGKL